MNRFYSSLLFACLLAGTLWAADDPFCGKWKLNIEKSKFTGEWDIEAYDGDGLTFNTSAYQDTLSMKFDGRDYEEKGPNVAPSSASSGKRVNSHTLEVTDKVKGEVMDHTKFEVSLDGKTLTLTIRETGQPKAQTIIYDKM